MKMCLFYRSEDMEAGHKGSPQIFGGHFIAHSIMAATKTVPDNVFMHSYHAHFVLAGLV
jgi:acyl-CoA thioesterase-2